MNDNKIQSIMARRSIIFILMFCCTWGIQAKPKGLDKVETKVKEYYEALKTISQNPTSSDADDITTNLNYFIGIDKNGIDLSNELSWPNDFVYLKLRDGSDSIFPRSYFRRFTEYCDRGKITKFEYTIKVCVFNKNPDVIEDKEPQYASAIVEKSFTVNGENKSMHDTVLINVATMTLSLIVNEARSLGTYSQYLSKLSQEQLFALANHLYNQKKYEEAGRLYEYIMEMPFHLLAILESDTIIIYGEKYPIPKKTEYFTGSMAKVLEDASKNGIVILDENVQKAAYNMGIMYMTGKYGKKRYSKKERERIASILLAQSSKGRRAYAYFSNDPEAVMRMQMTYAKMEMIVNGHNININFTLQ